MRGGRRGDRDVGTASTQESAKVEFGQSPCLTAARCESARAKPHARSFAPRGREAPPPGTPATEWPAGALPPHCRAAPPRFLQHILPSCPCLQHACTLLPRRWKAENPHRAAARRRKLHIPRPSASVGAHSFRAQKRLLFCKTTEAVIFAEGSRADKSNAFCYLLFPANAGFAGPPYAAMPSPLAGLAGAHSVSNPGFAPALPCLITAKYSPRVADLVTSINRSPQAAPFSRRIFNCRIFGQTPPEHPLYPVDFYRHNA